MAFIVDQKPNLKHFCKICKKGFGCGRALGGHMRAHGIGDESIPMDDDDPASDWDEKGNVGPSNRRMYALRTNPNRLKSCRVCENCGKEFLSWKSFLEHGKCTTSDDVESLVSSPCSDDDEECAAAGRRGGGGWSKRKRSLRVKVGSPSNEEEDLANCLMMLSNGAVDPLSDDAEESCASASKEDQERIRRPIHFIPPISYRMPNIEDDNNNNNKAKGIAKGLFECKACKKVFNSHQALGGHRASHKKVKGCFAVRLDDIDGRENDEIFEESFFPAKSTNSNFLQYENGLGNSMAASTSKKKTKVHECSICHRIFSSGQALGGHKRCHWITSNATAETTTTPSMAKIHQFHDQIDQHINQRVAVTPPVFVDSSMVLPLDLKLDLNLPAPADEVAGSGSRRPALEVSTEIYLQTWGCKSDKGDNDCEKQQQQEQPNENENKNNESGNYMNNEEENKEKNNNNNNNSNGSMKNMNQVEDEADSKVKLAKLSELKDMNMSGGNSSPWLQVGIGSTTDVRANP